MLLRKKIYKISVKHAFILMTALFLHCHADARDIWEKEKAAAEDLITSERLERSIAFLSDTLCRGRGTGTRGNVEAAAWIERQFREAGLLMIGETYSKRIHVRSGVIGRNIVGMIPGTVSQPCDRYVIVGAHYDHLGEFSGNIYPGADANASGTAAMISLAQMFAAMKEYGKIYRSNIIFVAFDAKEMGMAGSRELWEMIGKGELADPLTGKMINPSKVSLMINIDQIGSTLSPISKGREDYMIMLGTHTLRYGQRKLLEECNRSTGIGLDIALDYYGSRNFTDIFYRLSDQKVFADNRIPAVLFTSGITMNNNKTRDTVGTLDIPVLQKRIRLIFRWIEQMML